MSSKKTRRALERMFQCSATRSRQARVVRSPNCRPTTRECVRSAKAASPVDVREPSYLSSSRLIQLPSCGAWGVIAFS